MSTIGARTDSREARIYSFRAAQAASASSGQGTVRSATSMMLYLLICAVGLLQTAYSEDSEVAAAADVPVDAPAAPELPMWIVEAAGAALCAAFFLNFLRGQPADDTNSMLYKPLQTVYSLHVTL